MTVDNDIVVKTERLLKRYPQAERYALNGINLTIRRGEFFGLLGPNGSGKTTLISILCGLLTATAGQAMVCNQDVNKEWRKIAPIIGLVPQEIALYPTLSLQQNLHLFGNLYGLSGRYLKERIAYCLEVSQLARFKHKPIMSYSGGMKRRANLVAGLIHEPQVLFLDEPTANVDPQSRNVIYEDLNNLIKSGITVIYTTHYLEEAEALCSRLAIIDEGKIIACGVPAELIQNEPNCQDLDDLFLHLTGKSLRDDY
jgi:ABC-2 type transport system ATP-binding protein